MPYKQFLDMQLRLKNIVEEAICAFNANELYLVENDVSERCICAKFAVYLSEILKYTEYREYDVDVEYNRGNRGDQRHAKKLLDKPITVDLIVHRRGYDPIRGFDNLICIEMKKSTDRRGCTSDEDRLDKMTDPCYGFCYRTGFMIVINMKKPYLGLEIKRSFPSYG
ncbi:MAG: hypothetical protein LUF29_06645 [Oscillospiraceae bacterium]|nr:hypothetical protein [Oscillospiraceae bacterium]